MIPRFTSARDGDRHRQKIHPYGLWPQGLARSFDRAPLKRISISIPKLFNGDVSLSTNQSPSCNWKRQGPVRSEDSRLNYRTSTIHWNLSLAIGLYPPDIPLPRVNFYHLRKERNNGYFIQSNIFEEIRKSHQPTINPFLPLRGRNFPSLGKLGSTVICKRGGC